MQHSSWLGKIPLTPLQLSVTCLSVLRDVYQARILLILRLFFQSPAFFLKIIRVASMLGGYCLASVADIARFRTLHHTLEPQFLSLFQGCLSRSTLFFDYSPLPIVYSEGTTLSSLQTVLPNSYLTSLKMDSR